MSTNNDRRDYGQTDPGNARNNSREEQQNMESRESDRDMRSSRDRDTGDSKWNDSSDYSATSRGRSETGSEDLNDRDRRR